MICLGRLTQRTGSVVHTCQHPRSTPVDVSTTLSKTIFRGQRTSATPLIALASASISINNMEHISMRKSNLRPNIITEKIFYTSFSVAKTGVTWWEAWNILKWCRLSFWNQMAKRNNRKSINKMMIEIWRGIKAWNENCEKTIRCSYTDCKTQVACSL